jgi:hypothetical protein
MTVLAFGCSVTHGTEIAASGNSKANIPFSYPALVAKHFGVDCNNYAFCGNSNENIFHQALGTIPTVENITAVIVGWTSAEREVWQCDGRTWQFIPSWSATTNTIWRPFGYFKPESNNSPRRCADKEEYLQVLDNIYDILLKYKFDSAVYTKKRDNYISALRSYCKVNNICLLETCWADQLPGVEVNLGAIGNWYPAMNRHPNAEEQQSFADQIIKHYLL